MAEVIQREGRKTLTAEKFSSELNVSSQIGWYPIGRCLTRVGSQNFGLILRQLTNVKVLTNQKTWFYCQ